MRAIFLLLMSAVLVNNQHLGVQLGAPILGAALGGNLDHIGGHIRRPHGDHPADSVIGRQIEAHLPRFSLQALEEPRYIQKQIKQLVPVSLEDLLEEEWKAFKMTYNKAYPSADVERFRREVFIENRAKIARFNQEYSQGRRNYVQQLNPYGDLLHHEFTNILNGFNRSGLARPRIPTSTTYIPSANVNLPASVDWRQVGAVGPVKSQGMCACCWAFAAAGALEGHWFRKTGQLVDVSEQNLVDCTKDLGNDGCTGGLMNPAFEYVRQNDGVDSEESYPYEGTDNQQCRFKPEDVVVKCTGYVDIAEGDEQGLEIAIATLGPVTAAIDASKDGFQFYSDGVYYDPDCGSRQEDMNHAVLIVGYGQEPNGQKYWLVKNSYGPQWGVGGYVKMAKDANNHCGIANQASYPLV
ncbi:procathepsin L-like [Cylas formicarius]|uniref:procathepsin L-like n=1 Tax=Cylas formicarius TaxID=197179 RepID=UPI002958A998|nr:procathepsin L-like [Cylas formicarius]XP_060523575.1 procathepsin L-like [Cylas formicarius]